MMYDLQKAFDKEVVKLLLKTDIRQRFAEPEASSLCQQVDDAAKLADLLKDIISVPLKSGPVKY